MVNTQQFGELWMQLPPVDKRGALSLPQISSAQVYANSMREKLQFHPVDIINNEVICAGQSNGNPALIHCRVNPGGNLEFTIRSNPVELADQLMSSILPETLGNVSVASSNPLGGLF